MWYILEVAKKSLNLQQYSIHLSLFGHQLCENGVSIQYFTVFQTQDNICEMYKSYIFSVVHHLKWNVL